MRPATALLLAGLAAAALGGCHKKEAPPPQPAAVEAQGESGPTLRIGVDRSHRGDKEPAVPFMGPNGGPASLSTFRGKPLLVNLWATWCGPCVREMPTLRTLAAANRGRLAFVAVSQDANGRNAVAPFLAQHHLTDVQPYLDTRNVLMTALKLDNLPTTIFYDARGRERWRVNGDMDWASPEAARLIAEGLAG